MALDLLTGAVQAYIFAVLATVFIAAAIGEGEGGGAGNDHRKEND
jgi:F-type H+-transporting ATPase subunit a